jgi:non-ribosomal peptide synthetase component E (peptide arylation enzyme)
MMEQEDEDLDDADPTEVALIELQGGVGTLHKKILKMINDYPHTSKIQCPLCGVDGLTLKGAYPEGLEIICTECNFVFDEF